ncbi:MAG: hypothetical protein C0615_10060 [Desulfuromonas sp.]|nr:MAG: hypothetical protein C0615_10060 [Desulfuromonas sp.]
MNYKINTLYVSDVTINATTKCAKEHACLSGGGVGLCSVEYCINQGLTFVECVDEKECPYCTPFGSSNICLCPVRNELFNKYKI